MKEQYWDVQGLNKFGIKVPITLPEELRLRIAAAALSYQLGHKSMDYTYKYWKKIWEEDVK